MRKRAAALIFAIFLCFTLFACTDNKSVSSFGAVSEESITSDISKAPSSTEGKQIKCQYKTMNIGSSKKFTGDCLLINIFLSDSVSIFDEEEKQKVFTKLPKAEAFLKRQSEKYNKKFSMIYKQDDLQFDYKTKFVIPMSSEGDRWEYDLLKKIYAEYPIENVINKYKPENVSFLFHVNKVGASYACFQAEGYDSAYDNEICVVFTAEYTIEGTLIEMPATTYAHEILHLFGAVDLYDLGDKRVRLAKKYFPNDIMLTGWENINLHKIGKLTAYLIGWADYLDEKYEWIFLDAV